MPILLLAWVWRLPREEASPPASTGRIGGNLTIGASPALILQIVIYALF